MKLAPSKFISYFNATLYYKNDDIITNMIKYSKKIYFKQIQESWFDGKISFWDLFSFKAVYHLKTKREMWGIKEITHTIELDLEQDKQTIFSNFSKSYRQQIRKAEEDGITIETNSDVETFVEFFNRFAVRKGTFSTSRDRTIEKKNYLVISFAKHNEKIIAAHSYLIDRDLKILRHHQTSTARFEDNLNKNFVGQANKYLLATNLIAFKDEGFKIFDFGGYANKTTDESLLGINNYKLKFGGKIVECKNYYSVPYWILKKIGGIFGNKGTV